MRFLQSILETQLPGCVLWVVVCSLPVGAQSDANALRPGSQIERQLAGGQSHDYQLTLSAGQYAKLVVEPKAIDVTVILFAPVGKIAAQAHSQQASPETVRIVVVSEETGAYRIHIQPSDNEALRGSYRLKVEELRPAVPQDAARVAAERAFAEAEIFRGRWAADSFRKAIKKYEEALALFRVAGERGREADTLTDIGRSYDALSERRRALDFYNQALELHRAVGNRAAEASTLNYIGLAHDYLGEREKAFNYLNQALSTAQAAGARRAQAVALTYLGLLYNNLGERQKALDSYSKALALYRDANDREGEGNVLSYTGVTYLSMGQNQQALENLNSALPLLRNEASPRNEAYTLTSIGVVYRALDQYPKALEFFTEALPKWRAVGDKSGESATLHNIASVYELTGEYQKAIDLYQQALPLHRAVDYRIGEANTMTNIGRLYALLGDYEKSLNFFKQAGPLHRATNNRAWEAATLYRVGSVYYSLGEPRKALDYFQQALAIRQTINDRLGEAETVAGLARVNHSLGNQRNALDFNNRALEVYRAVGSPRGEGLALTNLGMISAASGNRQAALESYQQALKLLRATGDSSGEALTLFEVARLERDMGRLSEALDQIEAALKIIESLRTKVSSQQLRSSFLASKRDYYDLYVDLLMRLHKEREAEGFDAAALQASERARARSLLEILIEAHADIRQGIDRGLLERERSLQQLLNGKAERQTRLLAGKHTDEQAEAAAKELDAIDAEYQQVQAQVRAGSPRYAALTQPQPLNLKEIQERVIDSDTLLLEYDLGSEHSYLWVVSTSWIKSYELAKQTEIEAATRQLYELLKSNAEEAKVTGAIAALSRLVIAPAASELGTKRLLIVADGALNYVPFAALTDGSAARPRPLILEHEIVVLPSASTLALMRGEVSGRKSAPRAVAVLADPVFSRADPRVTANSNEDREAARRNGPTIEASRTEVKPSDSVKAESKSRPLESGEESENSDAAGFGRLIGTRREADQIVALLPKDQARESLDFDASKAAATSPELAEYRIVHFATHGLLNSVRPELSGIVLSLVNKGGEEQDGFLRLNEIYNLKLPVELVVLSACQTALGKEIRGEGLVGLTRGFMYAGAPRVMASLWKVDDKATSELMKSFYQGMLGPKHLSAAAALRAAQIGMLKQKRWQSSFYWASFVVQGEWK